MHNNCVITPSGDVLNRTTKQYLQGDEAQKVKDIINNRNNTQRQKQEKADRVIKRVYDAQKRVDKSRTDSENYYVLEEDGEYHAYSRVHTRLGSNWTQTQKQADALKHVQTNLSKFVDDPKQYDGFLTWLEKKYEIDLSNFRGKTDIKSREMVLNTIRDKMSGTNSTRALQAGSAVDTVIRQFFITSDTSAITRPSNMSETAFSDLIGRLEEVKSNMERQGMRFLTDNIVLFQKYPDGTRVAGEVDILAVDADGNFKIYDVKTSRYSFGNFTDRRGHTVNYFENKSPSQRMSNKDYYTLQLSAYKNLFESQFGEPITQIGIMPFVLSYDGNTVSNIKSEPGIFFQYNPAVNVPLIGSAQPQAQPQSQPQTQAPIKAQPVATPTQPQTQSSVPIFNANAETHNPVNMVIPEVAFDTQVTKTGYYIMDNKVHRGYLVSIGEINGVEVHVSKVPNITKGFKRPNETEHVASVNYIAVFPNGATVTIMQNVTVDTEQQAIDKIKAALNGNPQRVTDESSKETVLSKAQQPAQVSGAAATAQREQAIRGGISSKRRRPKLRKVKEESATVWDRDKEIAEITKMLPQLSAEDRIRFVKGLIRVADRGALAWGQMEDGIITLSDIAAPGTAYHEAFHVVFNHLLEDNERAALLQEARSRFGKGLSEEELEEELAEEFRMFQMGEITDNRSIGRKILDFFKSLITKTTNWKNFKPSSMAYYQAIRRGKYANKTLRDVTVSRLNREQYTQEMKYILANAPRDSQGRLLAPNGKPTNLTERQYVHVRTRAFKDWFGDWQNDPENASKVVDENGEPMVVYHGTPSSEPIDIFYTRQELGLPRGGRGSGSEGYYFTPNREYAERFTARDLMFSENTGTGHIEEVFLNARNVALFNSANFPNARVDIFYNMDASGKASFESLGYDGIELGRILNNSNGKRPEIVVFNKNQIKSATSNNGAYSRTNNDIRYRRLGEVRISTLDMVPQEERQILEKKGWTTEHFNRISQRERDKALECLGL